MFRKMNYATTYIYPERVISVKGTENVEALFKKPELCVSFTRAERFSMTAGDEIVLDFGREICGGVRIIVGFSLSDYGKIDLKLTFGESVSEAMSEIGEKNATNDHAPRSFQISAPNLSDIVYGSTGFRFVRIEAIKGNCAICAIAAKSVEPEFDCVASIKTGDARLDEIAEVAARTIKLNIQNDSLWDGIKRDRLIWCGDLNPEELAGLEYFNCFTAVENSLEFLMRDTVDGEWVNWFPSYSAWWVINYADALRLGAKFECDDECKAFARKIFVMLDKIVKDDGEIVPSEIREAPTFLDWPTFETRDAVIGTACIIILACRKYLEIEKLTECERLISVLTRYTSEKAAFKQTLAMQLLAGRIPDGGELSFFEAGGAKGFSTFMSYYTLKAYKACGGTGYLRMIKEYYGGMLDMGATSFWEDFDTEWTKNAFRIDELPVKGKKDIHGDFGNYCYKGFRHSLCHGWSAGVLAFIIEEVLGVSVDDGYRTVLIKESSLTCFEANLPTPFGMMKIVKADGKTAVIAPEEIDVTICG